MDFVASACNGTLSDIPGVNATFLNLINTFFVAQCSLFASDDYPDDYGDQLTNGEEFDFIVVGAGSAGSVVANRLSENPHWRILLIEAGGDPTFISDIPSLAYSSRDTIRDWNYTIERNGLSCLGLVDEKCACPRGKMLGGTSSLNGMYYVRGNREDFDRWERLGNKGWNYENVLKYFKKSEGLSQYVLIDDGEYDSIVNSIRQRTLSESKRREYSRFVSEKYHSTDGLLSVGRFGNDENLLNLKKIIFDGIQELGFSYVPDVNGKRQIGFTENQGTIRKAKRADTAKTFLNPVKDRPNLFVAKHSLARKILLDGKRVTGVEFIRKGTVRSVNVKKELILSAGSIDSPKLLLLSGIGPKKHLESLGIPVLHDLKGVGENLQDHLQGLGSPIALTKSMPTENPEFESLVSLYEYFIERNGSFSNLGMDVAGFIDTLSNTSIPDIQMEFNNYDYNNPDDVQSSFEMERFTQDIIDQYIEINRNAAMLLVTPTTLQSKSIGKLLLRSSDANDPPLIITNYFQNKEDLETLIRGYDIVVKLSETDAFKNIGAQLKKLDIRNCSGYEFKSRGYWECIARHTTISGFHQCCTCKMGPENDSFAVVDNKLKVYGIENLRVVDSSIMPIIPRGTLNPITIVIGEKASDFIKNDYSQRSLNIHNRSWREKIAKFESLLSKKIMNKLPFLG